MSGSTLLLHICLLPSLQHLIPTTTLIDLILRPECVLKESGGGSQHEDTRISGLDSSDSSVDGLYRVVMDKFLSRISKQSNQELVPLLQSEVAKLRLVSLLKLN